MNILVYIAQVVRSIIPTVNMLAKEGHTVTPVNIYDTANKLDRNNPENEFSMLWDHLFTNGKIEAVLSYHKPDELMLKKCQEHNVKLLIQEYYGHIPSWNHAIIPYFMDMEKFYGTSESQQVSPPKDRAKVIVPLEYKISYYSEYNTIRSSLYSDAIPNLAHWKEEKEISSNYDFTLFLLGIIKKYNLTEHADFLFRPHPKYMDNFKQTISLINDLNNPAITVNLDPAENVINQADIVCGLHSTFGFEALLFGADVITYKGKAHFTNPQLSRSPMNHEQLAESLKQSISDYLENGKQKKMFLDKHMNALQTTFRASYDPDPKLLKQFSLNAINNCRNVPILPEFSIR